MLKSPKEYRRIADAIDALLRAHSRHHALVAPPAIAPDDTQLIARAEQF